MNTIRINGIEVPIDSIDGPTGEELFAAQRKFNARRVAALPCLMQGSGSKFVGTPRHQKHKGDASAYGVRVK